MKKINILDCTLRDGSYVLDFNFTLIDTFFISKLLFESGIDYVEIGHGLGLGASKKKEIKSLHNDNEYIKIANSSKINKYNKIGCFCFVKNINYKNLLDAKKYGLDFIRFAYEAKNISLLNKYIKYCKKIGLEVHLNLIKTYKYSNYEIFKIIKEINNLNIDYVYIVDSAGGMDSEELNSYIKIIKKQINKKISLGFHGHNNLGMANSNCITAINNGIEIIDSSMLGMGRGAGNASTEMLAAYLQREKRYKNLNLNLMLNFIKNYLSKIFPKKNNIEDILMGKSYFHDSEIGKLKKFSKKNDLNYLQLLNKISFKKGINENKILKSKINSSNKISKISNLEIKNQDLNENELSLNEFKKNLTALQKKTNSTKVITICRGKKTKYKIYNENGLVSGHIESINKKNDIALLKFFKGYYMFFDENIKIKNSLKYSEEEIKLKAIIDLINTRKFKFIKFIGLFNKLFKKKILNVHKYKSSNKGIYIINGNNKNNTKAIKNSYIIKMNANYEKIDDYVDCIFLKPNYGLVLTHEIIRSLDYLINNNSVKRIKIKDSLHVTEKGMMGEKNDIIVDDLNIPLRIIGQSDGNGNIKENIELKEKNTKYLLEWMYNSYIN
tara:strand:- start:5287 stop:7119 length:1833 start_codon:yes stop_codon:yes gene_type:complete